MASLIVDESKFRRLLNYAGAYVRRQHIASIMAGYRDHLDVDRGPSFSDGFDQCRHPDCVMVRSEEQAQRARDTKAS